MIDAYPRLIMSSAGAVGIWTWTGTASARGKSCIPTLDGMTTSSCISWQTSLAVPSSTPPTPRPTLQIQQISTTFFYQASTHDRTPPCSLILDHVIPGISPRESAYHPRRASTVGFVHGPRERKGSIRVSWFDHWPPGEGKGGLIIRTVGGPSCSDLRLSFSRSCRSFSSVLQFWLRAGDQGSQERCSESRYNPST